MRLPTAARLLIIVVLVAVAVVAGFAGTYAVRTKLHKTTAPTPPPTPAALRGATVPPAVGTPAPTAPAPVPAAVARALSGAARATGLGGRLLARVVDVQTGEVLYDRSGAT